MSRMTLEEFSRHHGQTKAASLLGLSQGSLNKALRVGRDVFVTEHEDGSCSAEELKPFPSTAGKKTAA